MRLFGHPLHPMLVHFPIAFWSFAAFSDGLALLGLADTWEYGWPLLALGLVTAMPAMIVGFIDLAALRDAAERDGQLHMYLMGSAWMIFLIALILRLENGTPLPSPQNISGGLSLLGMGVMVVGGWYGGQLVYTHGAGRRPASGSSETE